MRRLTVKRVACNEKELVGEYAKQEDVEIVVSEDTELISEEGELIGIYLKKIPADIDIVRDALDRTSITQSERATKKKPMKTRSTCFGYMPAIHTRNHPCRVAALARTQNRSHEILMGLTKQVAEIYKSFAPEKAESHQKETHERIKEEYIILETMFTSGIVTKTSQLPYHYDSGNFKGAWSAMLGLSKNIQGGYLNIPEYNLALAITDGCLCFFDGQQRVHGVTPIKRADPNAERYTIVWYSLERLWKCLDTKGELARMNASQTAKNQRKRREL